MLEHDQPDHKGLIPANNLNIANIYEDQISKRGDKIWGSNSGLGLVVGYKQSI